MKRLLAFVCTIGLILGAYSCSNDFELVDKWKDIPVVYGLLDPSDDGHYIRVEKAFLDDETSALDIAAIVDSLYYPDAAVTLIRSANDTRYNLTRVDGNLEGLPRDEGVFANAPNYLYKLEFPENDSLRTGEIYEIEINRGDDLPLVTGRTVVVTDITLKQPQAGSALNFDFEFDTGIQWSFERDDALFFDLYIDFYYTESVGGAEELKSFRWMIENNLQNEDFGINITYDFENEAFFKAIGNNIEPSTGEVREFERMEIGVKGGGEEIFNYIQVNQVNTGITGSQLLPNYTNMSEGFGIFSSTATATEVYFLKPASLDSLSNGIYTKDLNFQ